jgi:hypothetical protein
MMCASPSAFSISVSARLRGTGQFCLVDARWVILTVGEPLAASRWLARFWWLWTDLTGLIAIGTADRSNNSRTDRHAMLAGMLLTLCPQADNGRPKCRRCLGPSCWPGSSACGLPAMPCPLPQ